MMHLANKDTLMFFAKFNLFAVPLYVMIATNFSWPGFQTALADLVTHGLSALHMSPVQNGLLISIPIQNGNWAGLINWDCTGWKSIVAFLALSFATPFSRRRKLAALALVPVIFVINYVRIIFMFWWVQTYDLAHYAFVHAVVWSWGLLIAVLALWMLWMKYDFSALLRNR